MDMENKCLDINKSDENINTENEFFKTREHFEKIKNLSE